MKFTSIIALLSTTQAGIQLPELDNSTSRFKLWNYISKHIEQKWNLRGYHVQQGFLHWFDKEDCEGHPSCYGNNPDSPYGTLMLPRGVGENSDFD